jgi:hypothetical protein
MERNIPKPKFTPKGDNKTASATEENQTTTTASE